MNEQRTLQQNKALHKWFGMVAEALNEAGYDIMHTLRHDVEIPWSASTVKELLWRPVQEAMLDKESTTELDTREPTIVQETLSRHLATKLGVSVPWPSVESYAEERIHERSNKPIGDPNG